jgi:hypothetical protein
MMILAGEAIGKWKLRMDKEADGDSSKLVKNGLRLPFRTQPKPGMSCQTFEMRCNQSTQTRFLSHGKSVTRKQTIDLEREKSR